VGRSTGLLTFPTRMTTVSAQYHDPVEYGWYISAAGTLCCNTASLLC
jgi:hypothetical protein